jgi:hypothetical protein
VQVDARERDEGHGVVTTVVVLYANGEVDTLDRAADLPTIAGIVNLQVAPLGQGSPARLQNGCTPPE